MARPNAECFLTEEEKKMLQGIEERFQVLFGQFDKIVARQEQDGRTSDMGNTMRRTRTGGDKSVSRALTDVDLLQEQAIALQQLLYACNKTGFPMHKLFSIVFGWLAGRIQDERMDRKDERDLLHDVLEKLNVERRKK